MIAIAESTTVLPMCIVSVQKAEEKQKQQARANECPSFSTCNFNSLFLLNACMAEYITAASRVVLVCFKTADQLYFISLQHLSINTVNCNHTHLRFLFNYNK